MSRIVIAVPPASPIFGFGEDTDGVFGFDIGYWATVITDTKYLDLVTSEHADKPKFMSMMAAITQPYVDEQLTIAEFSPSYDLDLAIGRQLDVDGQWIGLTRQVMIPITGFFFSLNVLGAGLNQAPWFHAGDSLFNTVVLDDEPYRRLLQAKARANIWDGTVADAYEVYDVFFNGTSTVVRIHDNQDMSMQIELMGGAPSPTDIAIIEQDYLGLRPEGVTMLPIIVTP